jgi:hypothetical protein
VKRLVGITTLLVTIAAGLPARATGTTPIPPPLWSGHHALPVPAHRLELGLFGSSHYGWADMAEVSLHPIWFFALPHVEVKAPVAWLGQRAVWAVQGRLSYPTAFLKLVSREGAGGLLPPTSSPPQALQLDFDVLLTAFTLSRARRYAHLATLSAGFAVAWHGSFTQTELPLLDFPFAYPRLAAIYGGGVPRFGVSFEGPLLGKLHYEASTTYYAMPDLPDVTAPFALEPAVELEYRFSDRVAVSLGARASLAKYPYGTLFHALPYADVRVGW